MSTDWRSYTFEEVQQLGRTAPPLTDTGERVCPVCGHEAVRKYVHEHEGPGRTVWMYYSWCSHCHRYSSSTGPSQAEKYLFDDPGANSKELRRLRKTDLFGLLDHLDLLWDNGVLPQRITEHVR